MEIRKRASERNHGWDSVAITEPLIVWDEEAGCIVLTKRTVKEYGSTVKRHCQIKVPIEDVARMVAALDAAVPACPERLAKAFQKQLRVLLRLTNACTGMQANP